jgi:hypothetical protein
MKNKNSDLKKSCVGIVGVVALLINSFAAEYSGSGDWGDDNWNTSEPTALMDTFIRTGTQVVTVTQHGEVAHRLTLGQAGSNSTLNISSGSLDLVGAGSQIRPGQLFVSWAGIGETTGVVNLSGGSLTALGYGTKLDSAGDVAQLNISGNGTFNLNGNLNAGGGHADAQDRVSITGSRASIEISNSAIFMANSTLSFTLDESGVSPLNVNSLLVDSAAKLVIDFGTYIYSGAGTDVILLVDANIFATAFNEANISYLNDAGIDYALIQDTDDSGDVYVAIPELGTYAWLGGLLALGCAMLCRRS